MESNPNNISSLRRVELLRNHLAFTKDTLSPSWVESRYSGGTSGQLDAEREKVTFKVSEMTDILNGGPKKTERVKFLRKLINSHEAHLLYEGSREERVKKSISEFIRVHKDYAPTFKPSREDVAIMTENSVWGGPLSIHYSIFVPTLKNLATEEQQSWWVPRAEAFQIIGSYAQTELGHGSNVRGLQTRAVFNKNTDEFILDTPTLRSIKWWPGGLGCVATHSIVYAQLMIDGIEYGVHAFMLQLRDENHKLLAGVTTGDLGNKIADNMTDTGFLSLEDVKIPRKYLLSRFHYVTKDGEYIERNKDSKKINYATMTFWRANLACSAAGILARGALIATRWASLRRQGFVQVTGTVPSSAPENLLIDYQTHQYRLAKQISTAYALRFAGRWLFELIGELEGSTLHSFQNMKSLQEVAITASVMKAFASVRAANGLEDLRRSCGGNGFLHSSGISLLSNAYLGVATAEGDYVLLYLLCGRFLLTSYQKAKEGKPFPKTLAYLKPLLKQKKMKAPKPIDFASRVKDLEFLVELFRYNALVSIRRMLRRIAAKFSETSSTDESWRASLIEVMEAAKRHCAFLVLERFYEQIQTIEDPKMQGLLSNVMRVFAYTDIMDENWTGILDMEVAQEIRSAMFKLLRGLRPNMLGLAESFDYPDEILQSAIGNKDGNAYEALVSAAFDSPLNKVTPFDGYDEFLKPHLDLEFLKRGNAVPIKSSIGDALRD
eukprot:CAMPEP_0115016846 /NCGR_PEP_ID=MMETSP0216-20121206/27721_1 /TAXON_ID=223996 /ORGANISM="Protocruzia adherens, Strain Boccale" /LENGTH=720 /DNA_ID=CAMNT_0002387463 /DNA_START=39 /DNA_END=2201 /DNA_ORIENTATION=+